MTDPSEFKVHGSYVMAFLCVLLVSCSTQDNSTLYSRLDEIKARTPAKIPSLPVFKAYETYQYEALRESDPFRVFEDIQESMASVESIESPLKGRNLEALEQYPLDTLKYVGQLTKDGREWAIITSPDLIVHRVKVGDHLGSNYGEILAIEEGKILIEEIIQSEMSGWIKREAALSLME
ncbi:MAG: pilus assembly protein PilP [Pseudomonadota bacterium]